MAYWRKKIPRIGRRVEMTKLALNRCFPGPQTGVVIARSPHKTGLYVLRDGEQKAKRWWKGFWQESENKTVAT